MVTLFPEVADRPTQHHIEFYSRRARGGVGLVIVGATYVSAEGKGFPNQMGIDEDSKISAFSDLAQQIQGHAPSILQLFHAGPKTSRSVSGHEVSAPSAFLAQGTRYDSPHALTNEEIETLAARFEAAAERAQKAGFCGVELHGANGYLLHAFSDPWANRRTDKWSCFEAFPTELVRRLRRRLSRRFLIGYTISPFAVNHPDIASADSLDRLAGLARLLAAAGVDYLHIYRGKAALQQREESRVFAKILRAEGITLPIVEGAGIRSAAQAEVFVREGVTLVTVGRALLGCPDLLTRREFEYPDAELAKLSSSAELQKAFAAEYERPVYDKASRLWLRTTHVSNR